MLRQLLDFFNPKLCKCQTLRKWNWGLPGTSREAHTTSIHWAHTTSIQRCDTAGHYYVSQASIPSDLVIIGLLLNTCTFVL